MYIPDSVDEKLVRLLGQDSRQTSEVMAKQLNLSAATVRRRLRKLLRNDSLRLVGVANPITFGFPLGAVIALDVAHDQLEQAINMLVEQPEIKWVSTTTGRFDIMFFALFRSTDALSDFITKRLVKVEGLKSSETFICLSVKKGHYVVLT